MSLADRLSEIDRELDALGSAHAEVTERARAQWSGKGLDAIDQALMDLSAGVTVVDTPSPSSAPPVRVTTRSTPDATTASGSLVAPTPMNAASATVVATQAAGTSEAAAPEVEAANDVVAPASEAALDSLFPDGEPDSETDSVSLGTRALTMSEPPMSEPPPPEPEAPSDDDPFGGMPAPVELPPRRPSMMPSSIAPSTPSSTLSMPPKHIPARTIRTSAAPPPPPLPPKSLRPRSISPGGPFKRPSDTPDPFPAQGRASSRPPSTLSADQLFGGTSVSPPSDSPVKLSTPPMTVAPATTPPRATTPPAAEEDDFELMIDDDMVEIDMDDVDELD